LQELADDALRDGGAHLGDLSPQVLCSLGQLLARNGVEAAVPLLRAAQRRYPSDFWLSFTFGYVLHKAKRVEEAVGYERVAVALRPDAPAAHSNLGHALYGTKDVAIAEHRKAVELEPKNAYLRNTLGVALYANNDVGEAIAAYQKAIELAPRYASAYFNLGHALHAAKDLDEAIAAYQKAIDCDPKHTKARFNFGGVLLERGRFAEARTAIRLCLELLPGRDPLRKLASRQLEECEPMITLEEKLSAVLVGEVESTAAERLPLAQLCQGYKLRHATAARL
jgi:Flp pilus assembly protein TadD